MWIKNHKWASLVFVWLCSAGSICGQLAITEVMSQAGLETNPGFTRPDYWELTNFGTNDIHLDGYSFSDSRQTNLLVDYPFWDLILRPNESVIFFRSEANHSSITNAERFRAWWGETNLDALLKIRTYEAPGLDGDSKDELWLYDEELNVVDMVRFGEARVGRSFVYAPDSGSFGVVSLLGVSGAFKSALGDDIGSPGKTAGAASLSWVQQPSDMAADYGADVTFSAMAIGLPRPKYQWFSNGVEIANARASTLVISNVQQQAEFMVRVWNGIAELLSDPVSLTVNTNPARPTITEAPRDLTVFTNQTAVFSVAARGFPNPRFQWQSNGFNIFGATQRTFTVQDVRMAMSGTRYTVQIWNEVGSTNASALLSVVRPPNLRITEVMANPIFADSSGHYDWFELTNFDTNSVNLQGYRFFDTPSFQGAFQITQPIEVKAGESVVFVEAMNAEEFWNWWGEGFRRPEIQIVTYYGFSLSDLGEQLYIWNAAALDPYDPLTTSSWAMATWGASLECTELYGETECLTDSVFGQKGAFPSISGDIASPGFLTNPRPRIVSVKPSGPGLRITCRINPGRTYRLSRAFTLAAGGWDQLAVFDGDELLFQFEDSTTNTVPTLFYRLEELP